MSITPKQRTKSWREEQINLLGKEQFNKLEYQKRKERKARARAQAQEPEQPPEPEQPQEDLLNQLYTLKSEYYKAMKPPRTIKIETVAQQLTKIKNIYKKIYNEDFKDFEFLKDTQRIFNYVNDNYNTAESKNAQYRAIASILQVLPEYKTEYNLYSKISTEAQKQKPYNSKRTRKYFTMGPNIETNRQENANSA